MVGCNFRVFSICSSNPKVTVLVNFTDNGQFYFDTISDAVAEQMNLNIAQNIEKTDHPFAEH